MDECPSFFINSETRYALHSVYLQEPLWLKLFAVDGYSDCRYDASENRKCLLECPVEIERKERTA